MLARGQQIIISSISLTIRTRDIEGRYIIRAPEYIRYFWHTFFQLYCAVTEAAGSKPSDVSEPGKNIRNIWCKWISTAQHPWSAVDFHTAALLPSG